MCETLSASWHDIDSLVNILLYFNQFYSFQSTSGPFQFERFPTPLLFFGIRTFFSPSQRIVSSMNPSTCAYRPDGTPGPLPGAHPILPYRMDLLESI